jgi:hypothetical protein
VECGLGIETGIDQTLVLMAPHDQVEKGREEVLGEIARLSVSVTI